jgi:hypothetical protein
LQLRAVELFYVFLDLPVQYLETSDTAVQASILDKKATFEAIQHAIYFPLGMSQLIASVLICFALSGRFAWLAQAAFALNALRLGLRICDERLLGAQFDDLYGAFYLPLVYIVFAPIAAWLVLQRPDPARPA